MGIPQTVSMKELVEHLRVRNKMITSAKRMARGAEKSETETILVEFESKVMSEELYFGFMKYRVREFIPKPM